jgi:hypothetical protein
MDEQVAKLESTIHEWQNKYHQIDIAKNGKQQVVKRLTL